MKKQQRKRFKHLKTMAEQAFKLSRQNSNDFVYGLLGRHYAYKAAEMAAERSK